MQHAAFTADAEVVAGTGLTPSASANSWQKWMQLWPGNCDMLEEIKPEQDHW